MKRLLFFLLSILLLAQAAWGATYFVSPTGSNTSPYDTWVKAANLPSTAVTAGNTDVGGDGPHTIYIAPGTYADSILLTDADWANSYIIGTDNAGNTAPAEKGQVLITSLGNVITVAVTGVTVKNLSATGTDSTHELLWLSGANNFVGENLYLYNSGNREVLIGSATNFQINKCDIRGSGTGPSIQVSASTVSGIITYSLLTTFGSNTSLGQYAIRNESTSGALNVKNSVLHGGVAQWGGGETNITNSIVSGGIIGTTTPAFRRVNGTATISNSLLIAQWYRILPDPNNAWLSGTITDSNNIKTMNPRFKKSQRKGFIIPCIDDIESFDYAVNTVEPILANRGVKGTWYVQSSPKYMASKVTQLTSVNNRGTLEIQSHGYSHTDLTLTGNVYSITKDGATINIDRTNNLITVSPGGSVTGFKSKALDDIKNELIALGCSVGALQTDLGAYALGEIMADSSGAQSSPYTPQILVDGTGATGIYKAEINESITAFLSQMGYAPNHLATPFGTSNAAVKSTSKSYGYISNRIGAGNDSYLANLNIFSLPYVSYTVIVGATDADTLTVVRNMGYQLSQNGGVIFILSHSNTEINAHNWELILDTIRSEYPDITITSHSDFIDHVINSGEWSTSNQENYTRTWDWVADFHLLPGSPCINKGVNVGLTSDFTGRPVGSLPDIGAYEYFGNNGGGNFGNMNFSLGW